jgi:hypothetical protein
MSYPSAFCVKCKAHTDTLGRHTVQLSNNRRALKGVCPVCATETYRFMPEKSTRETHLSLISSQRKISKEKGEKLAQPRSQLQSALTSRFKSSTPSLSRVDFVHFGLADRLLHYGILMSLFGLSALIGYAFCAEFILN